MSIESVMPSSHLILCHPLPILTPHHHRIAELVGVLIDNTIEFGLRHRRCADNHPVVERTAFTIVGCLRGQVDVFAKTFRNGQYDRRDADRPLLRLCASDQRNLQRGGVTS